jgi:ATP-dependent exoDNAse (exonuclease V) alpha subunit
MHKSQGQSFDKVHIDAKKIFAAGQLYVALSRARSLEGISLQSPLTANSFWADENVLRFNESIKELV